LICISVLTQEAVALYAVLFTIYLVMF